MDFKKCFSNQNAFLFFKIKSLSLKSLPDFTNAAPKSIMEKAIGAKNTNKTGRLAQYSKTLKVKACL